MPLKVASMKLPSVLSLAAVFAGVVCTAAYADDATDAIVAAAKAAQDAPAYRMKVSSTDPTGAMSTNMTLEIVNPESVHMKQEMGGKTMMELVTDGTKVFMSQGGGPLTAAPAQMGSIMKQARAQFSGDAVAKMAHDVKMTGHETVNGVPATIYSFNSDMMGLHSESKEWISDKDHRPLKIEGMTKGTVQTGGAAGAGQAVNQKTTAVYEYDPSIKITLPAS